MIFIKKIKTFLDFTAWHDVLMALQNQFRENFHVPEIIFIKWCNQMGNQFIEY